MSSRTILKQMDKIASTTQLFNSRAHNSAMCLSDVSSIEMYTKAATALFLVMCNFSQFFYNVILIFVK